MAKPEANGPAPMEKSEIRKFMRFAKKDPVHVAIALGSDGKAIMQMHKRTQPRALEKALKADAPGSKMHRFGTLVVDPQQPKLARFIVNKAGGGLARKLIVAFKGTGFNQVEIMLEDGTPVESEAGEDEEDEDPDAGVSDEDDEEESEDTSAAKGEVVDRAGASEPDDAEETAGDTSGGPEDAAQPLAASAADAGQEEGQEAPAAGEPDAAALAKTLTGLVKRMMAVIAKDPTQKAALIEMATDAQASLKRGDLAQASAGIDILSQALGGAGGGAPAAPAAPTAPAAPEGPMIDVAPSPHPAAGPMPAPGNNGQGAPAGAGGLLGMAGGMLENVVSGVAGAVGAATGATGAAKGAASAINHGIEQVTRGVGAGLAGGLGGGMAGGLAGGMPGGIGDMLGGAAKGADHDEPKRRQRRMHKSRSAWDATRSKIEADLDKLHKQVMSSHDDGSMGDGLGDSMTSAIQPILQELDEGLSDILQRAGKAEQRDEHEKLMKEAHATLDRYRKFAESNKVIAHLDSNPFVPMQIAKTISTTLTTLGGILK